MEDVVSFLSSGLEEKVFNEQTEEELELLRVVLDASGLQTKIKAESAPDVASDTWPEFFRAAQVIDDSLEDLEEAEELRVQYRDYCRRLGETQSCSSSLELFTKFFDPNNVSTSTKKAICKDIEAILAIIARAVISKSVESIVESWISVLEHHSSSTRGLEQLSMENEMQIAINGPHVTMSESVVLEAMKLYWSKAKLASQKDGHFVRTWKRMKDFTVSKAVDSLTPTTPRRNFMV